MANLRSLPYILSRTVSYSSGRSFRTWTKESISVIGEENFVCMSSIWALKLSHSVKYSSGLSSIALFSNPFLNQYMLVLCLANTLHQFCHVNGNLLLKKNRLLSVLYKFKYHITFFCLAVCPQYNVFVNQLILLPNSHKAFLLRISEHS